MVSREAIRVWITVGRNREVGVYNKNHEGFQFFNLTEEDFRVLKEHEEYREAKEELQELKTVHGRKKGFWAHIPARGRYIKALGGQYEYTVSAKNLVGNSKEIFKDFY